MKMSVTVWYGMVEVLRQSGHRVVAIAEASAVGMVDDQVFQIVREQGAALITRDSDFTNPIRFPASLTEGIVYIRRGNLSAADEIALVQGFLSHYAPESFVGKLVTLYTDSIRIR